VRYVKKMGNKKISGIGVNNIKPREAAKKSVNNKKYMTKFKTKYGITPSFSTFIYLRKELYSLFLYSRHVFIIFFTANITFEMPEITTAAVNNHRIQSPILLFVNPHNSLAINKITINKLTYNPDRVFLISFIYSFPYKIQFFDVQHFV
jgi:hypothetical protein